MNTKQANNQSDNGGNEMSVSSSRAGPADRGNLSQSGQSGTLHGDSKQQARTEERQSNVGRRSDGTPD